MCLGLQCNLGAWCEIYGFSYLDLGTFPGEKAEQLRRATRGEEVRLPPAEVKEHALCILEEPSIATFVHSVGKSNTDRDETYDFLLQSSGSGWSVATCRKTRHNTFGGPGRTTALDATARLESPNGETVTEYRVLITALLCSRPPSLARSLVYRIC